MNKKPSEPNWFYWFGYHNPETYIGRPIRGCATDEQYKEVVKRVDAVTARVRAETIEECAKAAQSAIRALNKEARRSREEDAS